MAVIDQPFLGDFNLRPVAMPEGCPFQPIGLALGNGNFPLEVVVATSTSEPRLPTLSSCWKTRNAGRPAPLLFVVLYGDQVGLCGATGDDPPAYIGLDPGQVERICREALEHSDRHAALRSLRDSLPAVDSKMPGVRNEGLFATHELITGVRERSDWKSAGEKARRILSKGGEDLLRALGFQIERHDQMTSILRSGDRKVALALLLKEYESPELQGGRFSELSPVSYALAVADRENLPYVVIQHGPKIRIHPTRVGVGVGRRSRTETYIECHRGLLRDRDAAYLYLLFSAEALAEGGSLEEILEESSRFAGGLAERLRDRIYQNVVPTLAKGIVEARRLIKPTAKDLADTYEMTLAVLFRLLFIAYGEDKDLLPYRWNGLYRRRSLKEKAQELLEIVRSNGQFDDGTSHWEEVTRLFHAVDKGNREWSVPAYDGGLFSQEPEVAPIGALLEDMTLPNTVFGPALRDLLLVETPEGLGPVDFRSLGVREFGTIYEGLLESELSVAETDLGVDKKGIYEPCKKGEKPLVQEGDVYLHNASGARKSTGSYFTKSFAVEHLLDHALEPALKDHIDRLDALDDDTAGEQFFDFRVADIAMGSGHFLVAAVDRVERAFTGYLSKRKLQDVTRELMTLRSSAREALGQLADQVEIEDTQVLRRLIARRCIYGVDTNPTAVQLARLAIWIHTFVPGLPLSLLDHNLVCGNSLVGIGRLSEVKEKVEEESLPLFPIDAEHMIGEAAEPLKRLASISDTTAAEVKKAWKFREDALEAVSPAAALCDIVTARRIQRTPVAIDINEWATLKGKIVDSREHKEAREVIEQLTPFHFPIAFPEVFLRERAGFDVILGNPPWEEARVEEKGFWARHYPGLRGLLSRDRQKRTSELIIERPDLFKAFEEEVQKAARLREALTSGGYPGMGISDPDLYKAFSWRFWQLVSEKGGRIGVVLPRSALSAKGSTEFRLEILSNADGVDITVLLNNRQWIFEDLHPQYSIGLVCINKSEGEQKTVALRGPYSSFDAYKLGMEQDPAVFFAKKVMEWNETASLPLLPSDESIEIFAQLRKAPRLDLNEAKSWRVRPHAELHSGNDKPLMDLESVARPKGFWPVYKGESFDIWNSDTGVYYAWGDPKRLLPALQKKRLRGGRNRKSPFSEFGIEWLRNPETMPCGLPRISFRDVTNRTNRRTVIVALVPPNVFLADQAPYLLWPRGDVSEQTYLLGILSSLPLDWYSRRFVESHVKYYIINAFPVPRPESKNPLRMRTTALAGRLACTDDRFNDWAEQLGVECGSIPSEEKDEMIYELDAVVAHLYGLKEKHLIHIFETFHEGWDYEERLKATLGHFRNWSNKL